VILYQAVLTVMFTILTFEMLNVVFYFIDTVTY